MNVNFAIISIDGDSHLHPRAGDRDEDHRWEGGVGPLMAVAGFPPVRHHAGVWRRHHRPLVGHHRGALFSEVNMSLNKASF